MLQSCQATTLSSRPSKTGMSRASFLETHDRNCAVRGHRHRARCGHRLGLAATRDHAPAPASGSGRAGPSCAAAEFQNNISPLWQTFARPEPVVFAALKCRGSPPLIFGLWGKVSALEVALRSKCVEALSAGVLRNGAKYAEGTYPEGTRSNGSCLPALGAAGGISDIRSISPRRQRLPLAPKLPIRRRLPGVAAPDLSGMVVGTGNLQPHRDSTNVVNTGPL